MLGSSPSGKRASITTPLISRIVPVLWAVVAIWVISPRAGLGECVGARHDLQDLLGDRGLAGTVHGERVLVDERPGVVGRVAHGGAARRELGGGALQQRAVDRGVEVVREQVAEEVLR